jgi:hypothetical protein
MRMHRNRQPCQLPYFFKARLTVERCIGLSCSLTKNIIPSGFSRSPNQTLIALRSSPRNGCVVESPPFSRRTCSTFSVHLLQQQPASLRHPQPVAIHQQHQTAIALLIPAALNRSGWCCLSIPVKCLRSPIVLSRVCPIPQD